jgi:hypothetical protein
MPLVDLNPNRTDRNRDIPSDVGFLQATRSAFHSESRSKVYRFIWLMAAGCWGTASIVTGLYAGGGSSPPGVSLDTVLSAVMLVVVAATLTCMWKWWTVGLATLVFLILSWVLAAVDITSGVPFGPFRGTGAQGPTLAGIPLLVGVPWLLMLPPSWGVADMVLVRDRDWWSRLKFAALSGLFFAAWGVVQVAVDGGVSSVGVGLCLGIPCMSVAGWFLASVTLTLAVRPLRLPRFRLTAVYALVVMLEPFTWSRIAVRPTVAAVGLSVMILALTWGMWREYRRLQI